jgi:ABC-2 type transport system permease protein
MGWTGIGVMGKTAVLVLHELQLLLKDRQALGLLFVMPMVFIVFLTLALQDVYLAKVGKKIQLEFVAGRQCQVEDSVCADLLKELLRMQYDIQVVPTATMSRQMTLILPAKIEDTVALIKKNKELAAADKVQVIFDPTLDQSVRALVEANLLLALQSVMIEETHKEIVKVQKKLAGRGGEIQAVADVNHFGGLIDEKAVNGAILPNPIQQTVPAWALFGMFFIVIPMANSMIRDRKLGVFKRLLSFPVLRSQLLAGKILPFFILNVLQFAMMFGVGVFVLPRITNLHLVLDFSYWHLLVVTAACAFAATSYGLMISCLAKTAEQASAFGALSVVILAIIGGVMIPRFVMPSFMQAISRLSPLHWGLEAYLDIIVRKSEFALTLDKILVLLGFGLAFLLVARMRFRWSEAE